MMKKYMKKTYSALVRSYIHLLEKQYKCLRYILQSNHLSDTLLVCFSGFSNDGIAKYNYLNTLKKVQVNKLFILDNFGYNKQGSYYLGENGDWFLPDMIIGLIEKIRDERKIKHLVMVGSSKGGSASLFYSIKMRAEACIIGAPQYFLGDYLSIDKHLPILEGIMGNVSMEAIQKLNKVLCECVKSATKDKPRVYIHYSPKEHTYHEHIERMIGDLEQYGYIVVEDADYDYADHGEVAKYFPHFLLSVLTNLEKKLV